MARRRTEFETNLIAVCRRRGDGVLVLLVREQSPGSPVKIVDRFACTPDELESRVLEARCGRILAILPSTATLVRTIHVPPAGALQVESAIRIEAESRLLGSAPPHRSGLGLIGIEGTTPTGLVVSWPDALDPGLPDVNPEIDVTWVPEIACLAAIAGDDPTSITAILDADGSTAAVVPTPKGPVYRATRGLPDASPEDRLRPLVAESLLGEGVDPNTIEVTVGDLLGDIESRLIEDALLRGPDADARLAKLAENGLEDVGEIDQASSRLLLAALGVASGENSNLAMLRRFEHREQPGILGTIVHRLSEGRNAVAIATIAFLLLIISPLAFSGLRLMIMRGKVENLAALEERVLRVENLQKVYRELDRQAWSVTKLLGDISNLMPEQIELVSVSITHGDPVTVTGLAKRDGDLSGTDIVFNFNRRLRESGLFADVGPMPSIDPPDGRGYSEFKITAELADPLRPIRTSPEDDYAVLSYRDRRYGPVDDDGYLIVDPDARQDRIDAMIARGIDLDRTLPPTEAAPSSGSRASSPSDNRASSPSARDSDRDSDRGSSVADSSQPEQEAGETIEARGRPSAADRGRDSSRSDGASAPASRSSIRSRVVEIPDPLSPEEIEILSNAEAKARLAKIAGARNAPDATDEQKATMKEEWDALLNRIRETNP